MPITIPACVRCHDGTKGQGKSRLILSGEPDQSFSRSYASLKPYVRWHEWGGASISQIATRPSHQATDASPLTTILLDPDHAGQVNLPEADRRRLYLWLDANAPFYGTYSEEEQLAQRNGEAVAPPRIQ